MSQDKLSLPGEFSGTFYQTYKLIPSLLISWLVFYFFVYFLELQISNEKMTSTNLACGQFCGTFSQSWLLWEGPAMNGQVVVGGSCHEWSGVQGYMQKEAEWTWSAASKQCDSKDFTSILGFRFLPWVSTMASLLRDCDMQSKPDKPSPSWVALGHDIYHSDRRQRQHSKIAEGERKGGSVFSATSTLWTLFYESIYDSYIKHVIIYL